MVKKLLVTVDEPGIKQYTPRLISLKPGCIEGCHTSRNLSFYLGYCSKEEEEKRLVPIREQINTYNEIVTHLWELNDFADFFASHGFMLSKNDIEGKYGKEIAEYAFALRSPKYCYPDLIIRENLLICPNVDHTATLTFAGQSYLIELNGDADGYPNEIDNKICFWNWVDGDTDYALEYVHYILNRLPKNIHINEGPMWDFDCYDQWRGNPSPAYLIVRRIFKLLKLHGYLEEYKLFPETNSAVWNYYTTTEDNSVGLYLCDKKAFRDKLLVAKINALTSACEIEYDDNDVPTFGALVDPETEVFDVTQPFYFLQDANDNTYISKAPGLYGGHKKLKIYGRLDCPSANRYIEKGEYVKHRVFFKDEETAIAAGYRPCGVCMKEKYNEWKKQAGK